MRLKGRGGGNKGDASKIFRGLAIGFEGIEKKRKEEKGKAVEGKRERAGKWREVAEW